MKKSLLPVAALAAATLVPVAPAGAAMVPGTVVHASESELVVEYSLNGRRGDRIPALFTFDVSSALLDVPDVNGDGAEDWADVDRGDEVRVFGSFGLRAMLSGATLSARHVTVTPVIDDGGPCCDLPV